MWADQRVEDEQAEMGYAESSSRNLSNSGEQKNDGSEGIFLLLFCQHFIFKDTEK